MVFTTDWWMKRAFKFGLKRYLGRLLRSEVDLEQLDVQLGKGTLELRGVLLNCDYLNEQMGSPLWEVTAGYVGCLRLVIPFTNLATEACSLELDEALLTVKPRATPGDVMPARDSPPAGAEGEPGNGPAAIFDLDAGLGPAAITDGVARIAGGIETILQRLRVQAARLTVRVELPPQGDSASPASLVVARLEQFTYAGEASPPATVPTATTSAPAMQLQKQLTFRGLTVELFEDVDDEDAPTQPEEDFSVVPRGSAAARLVGPSGVPADSKSALDGAVRTPVANSLGSPFAEVAARGRPPAAGHMESRVRAPISESEDGWEGDGDGWVDGGDFGSTSEGPTATCSMPDESRHVIICSSDGVGCSGTLRLHLIWQTNGQARPRVAADLSLNPLQIQLHPHHLPLLSHLATCLSEAAADSPAQLGQSAMQASQQPASRSFLADILLPDTTALAQDFLYQSWRQDASGAAGSEFFDAQSVLGSIKSGLSSFVSASSAGAAGAAEFFAPAFAALEEGPAGGEGLMGGLPHPPPGAELGGGQLKVETSDLSLILFYPESPSFSCILSEDGNMSSDFRPRLSVEVGDLALSLEASADSASASLSIYRLDATEYIPVLGRENAATAATLAETVRIPEALPPIPGEARPVHSFAGISMPPLRRSLNCSMLSQMSTHSAHMGPASADAPQVQIWPVFCCGGGRRSQTSTPSLSLQASTGKAARAGALRIAEGEGLIAEAKLKPLTLWLGLPLLQRMQSFLEPLVLQSTAAVNQAASAWQGRPAPNQRAAVSSAIDSILNDLQGFEEPTHAAQGPSRPAADKLRLSVAAPHICVIVLLPPMSSSRTPLNHGYSYLAIDLFAPVSAATPTATLTGSPARFSTASPVWDATATFARAKAYLLRTEAAGMFDYARHYGQEPCNVAATCIVDIVGPMATGNEAIRDCAAALTLDVRCMPSAEPSKSLLSAAWDCAKRKSEAGWQAGTKEDRSGQLDEVQFQDAASASSSWVLHFAAPDICVNVSQADVAAVLHLGAALVQWQADAAAATAFAAGINTPVTVASQTTFTMDCGVRCNLQRFTQGVDVRMGDRIGAIFQVDSQELRLFAVTGLEGRVNAATLSLTAGCLSVRGERDHAALLTCAPALPAGLDLFHVQRPQRPGALETEAIACASLRGITIATEPGDLTCSWLQRLGVFFTIAMESSEAVSSAAADAGLVDWTVQLRDCALRDEPRDADVEGAVAAALLLGGLRWSQMAGGTQQEILLQSLSLFAADTATRAPGFSPADAVDLPNTQLLACGYVCLAQEGGIALTLKPPAAAGDPGDAMEPPSLTADQPSQNSQAQPFMGIALRSSNYCRADEPPGTSGSAADEGAHATKDASTSGEAAIWRTEVTNQRLYCPLTRVAWSRINALAAQWSASLDDGADAPTRDLAPPDEADVQREDRARAFGVAVMDGVDLDAFRRSNSAGSNDFASSAIVEGGFCELGDSYTDDEEEEPAAPGGPSVLIQGFNNQAVLGEVAMPASKEDTPQFGVWYQTPVQDEAPGPPLVQEGYVKPPPPGYRPPTGQGSALGSLPEDYPVPASRLVLRNFWVVIALCRRDDTGPGGEGSPATSTRLELDLEDVCLQADTFHSEGPHARRLALSVRSIEFRDRALRADASPAWAKIFSHHVGARSPRDPTSCLLNVELESVRPVEGGSTEELRLRVSCLPIRLRVDQDVVTFLQAFFAPPSEAETAPVNVSDPGSPSGESSAKDEGGGGVYFQRCEIRPLTVVVDYKPRRLDVAALRAGNLAEVLNVAGWSNVALQLPAIRISGLHGWDALGALVAQRYLNHVASSQVHKFVAGIKPIQSMVRIGSAAGQLLAIPADALLRGRPDSAASRSNAPLSRQIQRGVTGLVRAILAEMLGMSAGALGGIHLVLTGHSAAAASSSQPSNVSDGLRQAADKLSSGLGEMGEAMRAPFRAPSGGEGNSPEQLPTGGVGAAAVRALRAAPGAIAKPLSDGAAAARCALLGARNSLDPDRFQERRLAN